jgi:hypothetical protein
MFDDTTRGRASDFDLGADHDAAFAGQAEELSTGSVVSREVVT